MIQPKVTSVNRYRLRDLRAWILGQAKRGIGGLTCIPEEVKHVVQVLKEALDLFLGQQIGGEMEQIGLEQRITRLVINGHIPLPCSLTAVVQFLGTHDTSSLLLAVLMSPAMGETTGRRSGQSRRKTQAR